MILKIESIGNKGRLETVWIPNISAARKRYDDPLQAEVIELTHSDGTVEVIRIVDGDGMYLCNDTGGTIEVLSRRFKTIETPPARKNTETE